MNISVLIWDKNVSKEARESIENQEEVKATIYDALEYKDKNHAAYVAANNSPYLMISNGATIFKPDCLRKHAKVLQECPHVTIVYSDYRVCDREVEWYQYNMTFDSRTPAIPPYCMIRSDVFLGMRGFDMNSYPLENTELYLRLLQTRSAQHICEPLMKVFPIEEFTKEQIEQAQAYIRKKHYGPN